MIHKYTKNKKYVRTYDIIYYVPYVLYPVQYVIQYQKNSFSLLYVVA